MGHTEGVSENFQNERHRHVRRRRAALSFAFIGNDLQLSTGHTETINRTTMSSRTSARKRKDPGTGSGRHSSSIDRLSVSSGELRVAAYKCERAHGASPLDMSGR